MRPPPGDRRHEKAAGVPSRQRLVLQLELVLPVGRVESRRWPEGDFVELELSVGRRLRLVRLLLAVVLVQLVLLSVVLVRLVLRAVA
eukprot:14493220-Alexandrium_andersonii.AAC.1